MKKVMECKGINICYEVVGNGFPLVMIMGLGANMDWWDPKLIERVSRRHQTVIFDNRGAGRTDAPEVDYSMEMFAEDTRELLDGLKIQKAHIFGVSMGGMIAQEFVLSHPSKVERLVLCSTSCGGSKSVRPTPEVLNLLMTGTHQTLSDRIGTILSLIFTDEFTKGNPDYVTQFIERIKEVPITPGAYARQLRAIRAWESYARLSEIRAPTLVMHGRKDVLIPPENAKILADRIPGARLAYFEESGHGFFRQESEDFVNTLLKFLDY